ncbi:ATP-binding protein [Candidatus Woesearchaeota archaeon]|nr:ATP-binding protein [Candidatus Woesearchaeota archaeon]
MFDVDINPNFKTKSVQAHRNSSLSEIVLSCERSISQKIRMSPGVSEDDVGNYDDLLKTFLGAYYSLAEKIEEKHVFWREKDKGYLSLVRNYSLYAASKAVLNKINDEDIERIRSYEIISPGNNLTYSDINQKSDYSLLSGILNKLKVVKAGNNSAILKYNYFIFFDGLREICKNYIKTNIHPDTLKELNKINIYKTGLAFNEIPPPQKKEFGKETEKNKATSSSTENLPAELPSYDYSKKPRIETVIGNTDAIVALRAAMIKALKYDTKKKANPFSMNGNSFRDAFILYGDPGVGKNFTIDALINHYAAKAKEQGINIEVVDLSKNIKSIYRDRSAQLFERYISLENEGDKVYFNVIDEGDGVFTRNEHGEMSEESKKLLREMKKAINNSDKGNALYFLMTNYAEQFEAALKQRFTTLELKGATTIEEFARSLKQELGPNGENLTQEQLEELGKRIYDYKVRFGGNGKQDVAVLDYDPMVPVTCRNVKKISAPFVSGNDDIIVANEDTILKASTEQIVSLIPKLCEKATYEDVLAEIEAHMDEVIKSSKETTARYNKK